MIYLLLTTRYWLEKYWPKDIVSAYYHAKKKVHPLNISKKVAAFEKKKTKYDEKISKAKDTYAMFNTNELKRKLQQIKPPTTFKSTKKDLYFIVGTTRNWRYDAPIVFVYRKGTGNKVTEKIVVNDYCVYSDDENGKLDWKTLGASEEELQRFELCRKIYRI